MNKLTITCREFRLLQRNTLRGFAEIRIAELRLNIDGIAIHEKNGKQWAQLPARPQLRDGELVRGDDGKLQYMPLMSFETRAVSDAFSAAVIAAVRELAPHAFEEVRA